MFLNKLFHSNFNYSIFSSFIYGISLNDILYGFITIILLTIIYFNIFILISIIPFFIVYLYYQYKRYPLFLHHYYNLIDLYVFLLFIIPFFHDLFIYISLNDIHYCYITTISSTIIFFNNIFILISIILLFQYPMGTLDEKTEQNGRSGKDVSLIII